MDLAHIEEEVDQAVAAEEIEMEVEAVETEEIIGQQHVAVNIEFRLQACQVQDHGKI